MIDANKNIGEKPGGLTTIFSRLELTNLVRCNRPNKKEPNTHVQGSSRIDYIFGSKNIRKHCKRAGILPFGIGYSSNHHAIFAEIDIESILSTTVQPVNSITARKLHQAKGLDFFKKQTFLWKHMEYTRH
jgi:hypothetical protein